MGTCFNCQNILPRSVEACPVCGAAVRNEETGEPVGTSEPAWKAAAPARKEFEPMPGINAEIFLEEFFSEEENLAPPADHNTSSAAAIHSGSSDPLADPFSDPFSASAPTPPATSAPTPMPNAQAPQPATGQAPVTPLTPRRTSLPKRDRHTPEQRPIDRLPTDGNSRALSIPESALPAASLTDADSVGFDLPDRSPTTAQAAAPEPLLPPGAVPVAPIPPSLAPTPATQPAPAPAPQTSAPRPSAGVLPPTLPPTLPPPALAGPGAQDHSIQESGPLPVPPALDPNHTPSKVASQHNLLSNPTPSALPPPPKLGDAEDGTKGARSDAASEHARKVLAASSRVDGDVILGRRERHRVIIALFGAAAAVTACLGGYAGWNTEVNTLAYEPTDDPAIFGDPTEIIPPVALQEAAIAGHRTIRTNDCSLTGSATGLVLAPSQLLVRTSDVLTDATPSVVVASGNLVDATVIGTIPDLGFSLLSTDEPIGDSITVGTAGALTSGDALSVFDASTPEDPGMTMVVAGIMRHNGVLSEFTTTEPAPPLSVAINSQGYLVGVAGSDGGFVSIDRLHSLVSFLNSNQVAVTSLCPAPDPEIVEDPTTSSSVVEDPTTSSSVVDE